MAKGKRVDDGGALVMYNTKVTPRMKKMISYLAGLENKSQREFLDYLILELYGDKHPEKLELAERLVNAGNINPLQLLAQSGIEIPAAKEDTDE